MAKTKLTDQLIDELTTYIENGMNNHDSAKLCLITEDTLYRWLREAEEVDENGKPLKRYERQRKLKDAMQKAQSAFKAYHVQNITKAARKNWQASAWMLERRFPDEYGRGIDRYMLKQAGANGKEHDDGLIDALRSTGAAVSELTGDVPEDV